MLSKPLLSVAALVGLAAAAPSTRSCNSSFKNIVFNSGVNDQPDIAGRFMTLQSYGVATWIGFTLDNASPSNANLDAGQIKMVLSGDNVQAGVDLITGPNAPEYLQILNEPDGGFYNLPVYSPEEAASLVRPLLDAQTTTKFLSPAPAYPNTDWLPRFFAACGCEDRFPVILAHVYSVNPQGAIGAMEAVMNQFPGKTVWVTELSPASDPAQNCGLDGQGVIDWMNAVVGWASQQPAIERMYWNSGEYVSLRAPFYRC